jgi:HSP90 family molecular chaperone
LFVLIPTSRILLEFVDNALDDAEVLFQENGGRYPYPVQISVTYDKQKKTLEVTDNCRGMSTEGLRSLVEGVGESKKKGVSWLNGQFGFGIHSFRAAAKFCTVITKNGENEKPVGFTISRSSTSVPYPEEVFLRFIWFF